MALPLPAAAAVAASPTWGLWARPADRPGQVALGLAVLLAVFAFLPRGPRRLAGALEFSAIGDLPHVRRFLTVVGFAAAFLSLAYIEVYLHGGPRAAAAPTFWLQGRALAHLHLTWPTPDPSASFRAAPLLYASADRLAGTGPPGYPLLLAPAFLVGAPMLVGPLVGAATVVATWLLAREMVRAARGSDELDAEAAGRIAAGLSVVCAALRHATADTVPDGLVALAMCAALAAALRATRIGQARAFALAGAAAGATLATAPVSSLAAGIGVVALALSSTGSPRRENLKACVAGALPGALLLLAANHAAVGHGLLTSPAAALRAMIATHAERPHARELATLAFRSFRSHLADIANFEPMALLLAVPLLGAPRSRATRVAGWVIGIQAAVQLLRIGTAEPRMDRSTLDAVLPIEHALLGVAVASFFARRIAVAATLTMAVSLAGFAVHTSHAHLDLGRAGAGRPPFEPDVVREAGVTNGLLFFDDDPAYELASDPGATASHSILAARLRGDDHDRLLFDLLGHPPAHRYLAGPTGPSVNVWTPATSSGDAWRFEAEADFPPVSVSHGRVEVVEGAGMCPHDAKALSLEPAPGAEATVTIELPTPRGATPGPARTWRVIPRIFMRGGPGEATMTLVEQPGGPPLGHWDWKDTVNGPGCFEIADQTVSLSPESRRTWLVVTARGGAVALDKTVLRPR